MIFPQAPENNIMVMKKPEAENLVATSLSSNADTRTQRFIFLPEDV
jgi:hypothetical protein